MRTIPIVIITAIAIASTATAYYVLRDHDWAKRAEEAKPSIGSMSAMDGQNPPMRDGRRDQPANLEPPRLTRLQEQVATLEARLGNMETAVSAHSQRQAGSGPDGSASNHGAETATARKQLTRLQEQVAALEARLGNTETAVSAHSQRQAGSRPDGSVSNHGAGTARASGQMPTSLSGWIQLWTLATLTATRPSRS